MAFAPNKRQAIIWPDADPIHWRIYAALGGDEIYASAPRRKHTHRIYQGWYWLQQVGPNALKVTDYAYAINRYRFVRNIVLQLSPMLVHRQTHSIHGNSLSCSYQFHIGISFRVPLVWCWFIGTYFLRNKTAQRVWVRAVTKMKEYYVSSFGLTIENCSHQV